MAGALLVPVSVTAKVLNQPAKASKLGGLPFNEEVDLESGVHVHWALPDALTRARLIEGKQQEVVFPGVPDLWLIVRLNPLPAQLGTKFKRPWAAWVVNSRNESVTPLAAWQAPSVAASSDVFTVAGPLVSATAVKYPGWGHRKQGHSFDLAQAAYYPEARKRFGFYDNLQGLQRQGKVTYVVVGWFSNRAHDPLYNSSDRDKLLYEWRLARSTKMASFVERMTKTQFAMSQTSTTAPAGVPTQQQWRPAGMRATPFTGPTDADVARVVQSGVRGLTREMRADSVRKMAKAVPEIASTASGGVREMVDFVEMYSGPSEIICHGTIVEVPLAGPPPLASIKQDAVRVYPSVPRAVAALAAQDAAGPELEYVEMLLDDIEHQKGTLGGIIDMPGAAHAKTFQSVAGKAKRYARLEAHPVLRNIARQPHFMLQTEDAQRRQVSAGNWPMRAMSKRSVYDVAASRIDTVPSVFVKDVFVQGQTGPTQAQEDAWIADFIAAFNDAKAKAAQKGKPIDPRIVRVHDARPNAQPSATGKSVDRTGSDSAGWFLDTQEEGLKTLREFFRGAWGAKFYLPNPDDLYETPGPNWYRPWSPQVVLTGVGRSYRFGEDGRFRADKFVDCRRSGEVMSGLKVAESPKVYARDTITATGAISSKPGIPSEAKAIVEEAVLLDSDSGAVLASHVAGSSGAASGSQYRSAIQGLWLARDASISAQMKENIDDFIKPVGEPPSPIAVTIWKDPVDPVFIDVNYAHPHSSMQNDWELKPDFVEMTTKTGAATEPPVGQVKVFNERARVTSSVMKVLDSSLITKLMLDKFGNPVPAKMPPGDLPEDMFLKLDVLSAPLARFDEQVFGAGLRERTGALRLNRLTVVDTFGIARKWNSGIADEASPADSTNSWWTALVPRLPYWSRLQHRLLSAANPQVEADPFSHPICGFLLPDFIEHSAEVFDSNGKAIGQLTTDRPQLGTQNPRTLMVKFEPHAWLQHVGDPLDAITNPILRQVVAGIAAQSLTIPPQPAGGWFETGLTALLRVVDTVRGTLDPTVKTPDRKVRLLGEPIVVLNTRLTFEATNAASASALKGDPPLLGPQPALPTARVKIGEVSRPDDGVIGCFLPNALAKDSRFAPVSFEAASSALINGLISGAGVGMDEPVTHPFIHGLESEFDVTVGQSKDVIVLMDARGAIYSTVGALPRKKISIPREHLDAALRNLEASFRAGPILSLPMSSSEVKPAVTPIALEGYDTEFIRVNADGTFVERPVPQVAPVGELPLERVKITRGWLRVARVAESD